MSIAQLTVCEGCRGKLSAACPYNERMLVINSILWCPGCDIVNSVSITQETATLLGTDEAICPECPQYVRCITATPTVI